MKRRYHLHLPGVIYSGLAVLVALAAMNSQNNLLFWIFGIMCAGLILSGLVSGMMMLSLDFKRLDPQFGTVGEPLLVRFTLTNHSRFLPAFNIVIGEQPVQQSSVSTGQPWQNLMQPASAWIMHVGPGETVHGEAIFWPTARGEAVFDRARLWTTFPFGLMKKSITFKQPQHTLIYPQLYELRADLLRSIAPPAMVGHRTIDRTGSGDEYFGLREHRQGDSVRSIAWKRSAHLDQLVTIDRASPSPPRLRILLDLTVPTNALRIGEESSVTARELEERAISLAASIAHAAHEQGMEIALTGLGIRMPHTGMRRSPRHVRKILATLAAIDLNAPRHTEGTQPVADAERAGVIIVHPHRVEPYTGRSDVMHVTAAQLDTLAVGPIGWDTRSLFTEEGTKPEETSAVEAAA